MDATPIVLIGGTEERTEFGRGQLDGVHLGEEAAVEVVHTGVAAGASRVGIVHRAEESAEEVVGRGAAAAFVQQAGKEVLRQQADVLSEHGDKTLEDEAAGANAVPATRNQRIEGVGDIAGGFAGDWDPVIAEEWLERAREEVIARSVPSGQVGDGHAVYGVVELGVEVVDSELGEVAQGDVGRAVRYQV